MMTVEAMDANDASESSELATALEATETSSEEPQTLNEAPQTSSEETLKTEEQVPWHKDKRWQEWKDKEKQLEELSSKSQKWETWEQEKLRLEDQAKVASMFQEALKNPEFATGVYELSKRLKEGGSGDAPEIPPEYNDAAKILFNTEPFAKLKQQIDGLTHGLTNATQTLQQQKETAIMNRFYSDYEREKPKNVVSGFEGLLQKFVAEEVEKMVPDLRKNPRHDAGWVKKAMPKAVERYDALIKAANSSLTKEALNGGTPKTQRGGVSTIQETQASEKEALTNFANQLRALSD